MDSKDYRIEYLAGELSARSRDYETVKSQLRTELDGPTQNRLKLQLESIGRQMEEYEEGIKTRKQELKEKADRDALARLMEILQRSDAQFDEMRRAYQAVMHARSFNGRPNIETVRSLTTEIVKIPKGRSNYTALEEFSAHLLRISDNRDLVGSLQGWGDRYCNHWSELLEQLEEHQDEREQNVQTALLIVVSPSDESATQSSNEEEEYRFQMWLIENIEQYKTDRQGYQAIGSDTNSGLTGDETYSLESIPDRLKHIFEERNVLDELSENSEIHFFLPQKLLNCDADIWRLIKPINSYIPIGHHCKFFVRLYERLSRSHNPKKWKEKWKQKKSLLQKKADDVFIQCDDYGEDFYYDLMGKENTVGLKLIKAPSQDCLISIFNSIFMMGFPLAIWGRSNLSEATNETELNRVLEVYLGDLPQTVKNERVKSRRQPMNGHIGHHLSLLWDDPDLVPPKSA